MFINYLKKPELFVKKIKKITNIILTGPENSGKYTQALHIIKLFSNSNLNYFRKIEIEVNGEKYYFNISDVHFEIDFELLGTNENVIWFEFITTIRSIVDTRKYGILLCKNVHCMKDELLSIFHTFMRDSKLNFILLTKHVSYFPDTIKDKCIIYNLKQRINTNQLQSYSGQYKVDCDKIVVFINTNTVQKDLFLLRELLYQLLTYNYDIHECMRYIFFECIRLGIIKECNLNKIFKLILPIIKHYNTNYRPIYHLELFVLTLYC